MMHESLFPPYDVSELRARFRVLAARLGSATRADAVFTELSAHYGASARRYHTLGHIADCLAVVAEFRGSAVDADLVEFALWAHDVIYDPRRSDNERLSGEWARRALLDLGAPRAFAEEAYALVIATTHSAVPAAGDAQLVCDVDLSILAASAVRFDAYEAAIREEYAWVPAPIFRRRRAEILEQFLARPAIYATAECRERFEAAARSNLQRSLAVLREG
jgi:predicted metal-dependent HD superfamily phosphohydrolase